VEVQGKHTTVILKNRGGINMCVLPISYKLKVKTKSIPYIYFSDQAIVFSKRNRLVFPLGVSAKPYD